MTTCYTISRFTSEWRETKRHIRNKNGHPLCGKKSRNSSWQKEEDSEPTCSKCLDICESGNLCAECENHYYLKDGNHGIACKFD